MFAKLLPQPIDNTYRGHRLALWLFALVVSVKIFQTLMGIFNGYATARFADGIPLETFTPAAAQAVLAMFSLSAFSRLMLSLLCVLVLVRYRSAITLMFAVLVLDYLGRQLILHFGPLVTTGTPPGPAVNLIVFALTIVGLVLSQWNQRLLAVATALCLVVAGGTLAASQAKPHEAGFCLVAAEAPTAEALPAPGAGQRVLRYDQRYLVESERGAPSFLLLPVKADVDVILAKAPILTPQGSNGFPELSLELTTAAAANLERVTREHLGQRVAFVIDGEVISTHKIRSAITGGQFRLSRCTDHACQYIYGRLTDKK